MIMVVALALIGTLAKDDHPKDSIPACKYEDGSGQADCYWDAQTQGNGKGHDYVKITTR